MQSETKIEYWFDQDAADHAVGFFPAFLKHAKGERAGQPVASPAKLTWQKPTRRMFLEMLAKLWSWWTVTFEPPSA